MSLFRIVLMGLLLLCATARLGASEFKPGFETAMDAAVQEFLERASGQPYETLLKQKLLIPLGMKDTRVRLSDDDVARLAAHYWPNQERIERERWIFGEVCAFGGLASTVPDLARFASLHLGATPGSSSGPVKGDALLRMRETVADFGDNHERGYTRGWFFADNARVGRLIEHGGEVDGHSSWLSLAPEKSIAIIVLVNVGGNTAERLKSQVARVVIGHLPDTVR